jgi:hypothetical protein
MEQLKEKIEQAYLDSQLCLLKNVAEDHGSLMM